MSSAMEEAERSASASAADAAAAVGPDRSVDGPAQPPKRARVPAQCIYKLWKPHLERQSQDCADLAPDDPKIEEVIDLFESALISLYKMPRIWLMYCSHLMEHCFITRTRLTFDRALQSLPLSQHDRIWPLYLDFIQRPGFVPAETGKRVFRRYLKIAPAAREDFIKYLKANGELDEAAQTLAAVLNDDAFVSQHGRSKQQLWDELCRLLVRNPQRIRSLPVDKILRAGIRKYPHQSGLLWTALADYYIRSADFERARDIYEEAIQSVPTVKDFRQVFDAYQQCEETMISAKMEALEAASDEDSIDEDDDADESDDSQAKAKAGAPAPKSRADFSEMNDEEFDAWMDSEDVNVDFQVEGDDLDQRLVRLEALLARRPLLVNSVHLRQNPHSVDAWLERVQIHQDRDDPAQCVLTLQQATHTVDPQLASGKPYRLWTAFARFYEDHLDDKAQALEQARTVFEVAVKVNLKSIDELASVYCAWVEMELRHGQTEAALAVIRRATVLPNRRVIQQHIAFSESGPAHAPKSQKGGAKRAKGEASADVASSGGRGGASSAPGSVQARLWRSTKLWALYADLETSLGTLDRARAVYDQMLELRVASPQIVLNYATLLAEHKYFEDSFKVFERGLSIFPYPHSLPLWTTYLKRFIARYKGKKLERTRELFEQAIHKLPAEALKPIFLLYARLEELYGASRRAMRVYDRACGKVPAEDRFDMYLVFLKRAAELFGVTHTREIYQQALKRLPDINLPDMCLRFARMEVSAGEVKRAREVFAYGAQYANPKTRAGFWKAWEQFEVEHGTGETFADMLRVQRTVDLKFHKLDVDAVVREAQKDAARVGSDGAAMPAGAGAGAGLVVLGGKKRSAGEAGLSGLEALEAQAEAQQQQQQREAATFDEEEIDIGDDDDDMDEDDTAAAVSAAGSGVAGLQRINVPSAVFGGLEGRAAAEAAATAGAPDEDDTAAALEGSMRAAARLGAAAATGTMEEDPEEERRREAADMRNKFRSGI